MAQYRIISRILREIASDLDMEYRGYGGDWVMQLTKNNRRMYVSGYQFPLNDAAAEGICGDKSAAYEVLTANGVEAAEHTFFMSPVNMSYSGPQGNWKEMSALLDKYGRVVVKNNYGTGGLNIYIAENHPQLEKAVSDIFKTSRGLSISPYYPIENEYRIIWCMNSPELCYKKIRQSVIGDGESCIAELIAKTFRSLLSNTDSRLDMSHIPEKGETVFVNWKHNLGQGASAELIPTDSDLYTKLIDIASRTADVLNINFASIDIIETRGRFMILEVNSGIMTESFASVSDENYKTVYRIYEKAVRAYFGI